MADRSNWNEKVQFDRLLEKTRKQTGTDSPLRRVNLRGLAC